MQYSRIADAFSRMEATTKRLEITSVLVALLSETPSSIIDKVVYLIQGQLYPNYLGIELGIADRLAIKAIAKATGTNEARVTADYKKEGDLGIVAETHLGDKPRLVTSELQVEEVYGIFDTIAKTSGSGSTETKVKLLIGLMGKASPPEAKYIVRMALGKLRLGVADMTILDALASKTGDKQVRPILERAYNLCSDLGYVAKTVAEKGIPALESFSITVGKPIRSMLAERLSDTGEILAKMGGEAAAEYKYDGLRIQAHISPFGVTLFSRRMENITEQFPDIRELLSKSATSSELIVEGEAVPVDLSTGDLLPFQLVSQRRGRKHQVDRMVEEVPVSIFLFDLLFSSGLDYTLRSYPERREALSKVFRLTDRVRLATQTLAETRDDLDRFMEDAIGEGCEGIMVKSIRPDSYYQAGARGWTWIKYKRDYKSEMQDTVDLVVVGAFAGRGRRGGAYGALLLAAYDENDDTFRTVCKCGSGFTDKDLVNFPGVLDRHLVSHRHARVDSKLQADVWFVPAVVLEVAGSEVTLSPIHTCGMNAIRPGAGLAIRFPRFTGRYRNDKMPEQATTTKEVTEMYRLQDKKIVSVEPKN